MDVLNAPKFVAAFLVGGAAVASLPRLVAPEVALLKLEWTGGGETRESDSLVLRTVTGETTEVRQGTRTVRADLAPSPEGDGNLSVRLRIEDPTPGRSEALATVVRVRPGETVMVMGTTRREGSRRKERLLFLTATPQG